MSDNGLKTGSSRLTWVAIFAAVALALLGAGYWYDRVEIGQLRRKSLEEISAIGELKAGQIEQWRKDRIADATRTAKDPLMRKAVTDFLADPGNESLRAELLARLKLDQTTYGYYNVALLNLKSEDILSANNQPEPLDPAHNQAAEDALASKGATISDLYRTPQNRILIDTIAPISDDAGRTMAFLEMNSDAETYLFPLVQYWPTPSPSAETILVRREGDHVLFLNELRFQSNAALNLSLPMTQVEAPAVQAAKGLKGTFEGRDYRGIPVLSDLRPIHGSSWLMVVKVNQDEILSEAHYRAGVIAVVVTLIIFAFGAALASLYRQRQAGLFQKLYGAEHERGEAMEEFRATLYSIGDAVVTTDRETRIQRMNRVGEQLTGWTEEQARNRPLDEVFQLIVEDTRAKVESPAQVVLSEGKVQELANHVLLVARDGVERPIANSFAPILDEGGAPSGAVVVFRDQTRDRATRAALEQSEKLYHSLFENMLDGFAYCRMIFDGDQPVDFQYLKVNSKFEALTGLKDVEGKNVSEVIAGFRESDPGLLEIYGRVARTGEPERFERRLEALQLWFSVSVYSPERDHFVAVFDNIGDRKRAEETLHTYQVELETQNADLRQAQTNLEASQNRYFELYDLAPVGYLTLNATGLVLEANLTTAAMMGREKKELVNRPLSQFISPPDQDIHYLKFKQLMQSGAPQSYELRLLKSDGTDFWARIQAAAGKDADGGLVCRMVISDVSLRKHAEEALKNSEELYHSLFTNMMDVMVYHRIIYENGEPVDYEILTANPAFQALSGIKDVAGRKVSEVLPGVRESDPGLYEVFRRVALSGKPEQVELYITPVHGWFRYSVYRPSQGYLAVIFHDVTPEKQAEEEMRKSEEKYRLIADSTTDVIAIHDLNLNATYVSPSEERLRGYTPAESMAQSIDQLLTPESLRIAREVLARELAEEQSGNVDLNRTKTMEMEEYHKNGGTVWVEIVVSFLRDSAGKPVGILSVARDITARKAAQEAERIREERFRHIAAAADVITIRDLDLNIIYSSPSVERLRGYTVEESMDQSIEQVLTPESLQLVRKTLDEQLALEAAGTDDPGRTFTMELEQYHKNGSAINVEVTASFLRDGEGKPAGLLLVTRDITDCKKEGRQPCTKARENDWAAAQQNGNRGP